MKGVKWRRSQQKHYFLTAANRGHNVGWRGTYLPHSAETQSLLHLTLTEVVVSGVKNNPIPPGVSTLLYSFKEAVKQSEALSGACEVSRTKQFALNDEQGTVSMGSCFACRVFFLLFTRQLN